LKNITFITRSRLSHHHRMSDTSSLGKDFLFMLDAKQRKVAGTVFDRNKRREAEINDALRQEQARHEAAVKNMHRLRALRLQHDKKTKGT